MKWNNWLKEHAQEVLVKIGIKEKQVILDFGCGSGAHAIPAAKLVGKGGKVYALDKDAKALKALKEDAKKEGLENIETILSSNLGTGLDKESVDIVILYDVIHLIEDRAGLFAEIYKVLKPDGFVSIYPMHVKRDEILRQASESGFCLRSEIYEGNILNFERHLSE